MYSVSKTVLLGLVTLAVVAPLAQGQFYGNSYFPGHKKKQKEHPHDPCEHFVCTTGKDGRRTFCRVAHVCEEREEGVSDVTCNFTLPVCVNRASEDAYYDYQPEHSVCKKGNPVINLSTGNDKDCNGTADCPMGYECVDPDTGNPTDDDGVCCLEQKMMDPHPVCPKIRVKFEPFNNKKRGRKKSSRFGGHSNPYATPFYRYNVCMTKCYSNYDCEYGEICCNTGCGYKCIEPKKTTTTSTTTTTTTTTPTTPVTTTPTTTPIMDPQDVAPLVSQQQQEAAAAAAAAGNSGLFQSAGANGPIPRGGPVLTSSRCPIDHNDVICGQIMCRSDDDCDDGLVCCDSKTCNSKFNQGSICMQLPSDQPQNSKPTSSGIFGSPVLAKSTFPGFGGLHRAPSFGGSFVGSYKPKSSGSHHDGMEYPDFHDSSKGSSHEYPQFPKTSSHDPGFSSYPKFPQIYQHEKPSTGFAHAPKPTGFNSYDKSSPFQSSPFHSILPKKQSYDLPKFGFAQAKTPSEYDGHKMGDYESDMHHDDMYGQDNGFFLKKKK